MTVAATARSSLWTQTWNDTVHDRALPEKGTRRSGGAIDPSIPFAPVRVIADATRLGEGQGARFEVTLDGVRRDAFAVRFKGRLHAYVNACRHQHLPLDFGDGRFFDDEYDALVCCHHGARYRPDTGECVAGPCAGARLTPLALEARGEELWCVGSPRDVSGS